MSLEDILYPLVRAYEQAPQPVRSLAGWAYRQLPSRIKWGNQYDRFKSEAESIITWSEDEVYHYQLTAIQESIKAASAAPYYQKQFASAGVNVSSLKSLEDIKKFPFLTKQAAIENRDLMVNSSMSADKKLYTSTGGSSGEPFGFYLEKGVSRPKEQAYLEASWSRRGWQSGDRVAVLRGHTLQGADKGNIISYDPARNWLILSSAYLTEKTLDDYLDKIHAFKPQHLHAYPSSALTLARLLHVRGLKLKSKLVSILCGSEKLEPQAQQFIEDVLGAPVLHWYGHSERVVLASQGSNSNHLYFWPTYGYVEFGDKDENGSQEVIGTSFHNHVMPLIRYRTGDLVKLATKPQKELPWLEVERVTGRDYEFLVSSTGRKVSLTAINMHDDVFEGVLALQFHQTEPGEVELCYQPVVSMAVTSQQESVMKAKVMQKLGVDFKLSLKQVATVQKTAAGKHRWLITTLAT